MRDIAALRARRRPARHGRLLHRRHRRERAAAGPRARRRARKLARFVSRRPRAGRACARRSRRCPSTPTCAPARPAGSRCIRARPARTSCTRTRARRADDRGARERRRSSRGSSCTARRFARAIPAAASLAWQRNCVALGEAACVFDPMHGVDLQAVQLGLVHLLPLFPGATRLRGRARRVQPEPAARPSSASATSSRRTTC